MESLQEYQKELVSLQREMSEIETKNDETIDSLIHANKRLEKEIAQSDAMSLEIINKFMKKNEAQKFLIEKMTSYLSEKEIRNVQIEIFQNGLTDELADFYQL